MENNIETNPMNQDILAGKWKQMRGELKTWWGKLTDDDFDRIGGQKEKLIGVLQERYGYAREQAEQEIDRRLQEYGDKTGRVVAWMSVKAREFGTTAAKKANEAAPVISEKVKSLASVIREKATHEGKMGTAVTKVAAGLESASCYLQERKFDHLGEDLTDLIRRYPLQSLLVGLGLGFLLAGRGHRQRRPRERE
jgi:uncharacterized protein YjbJ (UPF0337 family)